MFRSSPGRPPRPPPGRIRPIPGRRARFRSAAVRLLSVRGPRSRAGEGRSCPRRHSGEGGVHSAFCGPKVLAEKRRGRPLPSGRPSLPPRHPPPARRDGGHCAPPLTADRIPPAARSGSSACAAPRTSPGAAPRMRARFSDAAPAGGSPADVRRSAPGRPEAPDFRVGAPPAAEAENASKVLNFSGNAFRGVEIR